MNDKKSMMVYTYTYILNMSTFHSHPPHPPHTPHTPHTHHTHILVHVCVLSVSCNSHVSIAIRPDHITCRLYYSRHGTVLQRI